LNELSSSPYCIGSLHLAATVPPKNGRMTTRSKGSPIWTYTPLPGHGVAGRVLAEDQQDGATPFSPRTNKDLIEEALFARRRDLFSDLDIVFFDTTSIYFEGQGGETIGQHGHSKDHRPD